MPTFADQIQQTRSPRNSLLAAGLLVALVAVLVGFHGASMMLSMMSYSGSADPAKQADVRPANAAPVREISLAKPTEPQPLATPGPMRMPVAATVPAQPVQDASAAAATDQTAGAGETPQELTQEVPQERPRRPRQRYPRVELHKVY